MDFRFSAVYDVCNARKDSALILVYYNAGELSMKLVVDVFAKLVLQWRTAGVF